MRSAQLHHRDIHERRNFFRVQTLRKAVLVVNIEPSVGYDAHDRLAGEGFELGKSRPQDFHIAAEFVDDKAPDTRLFVLFEQLYRAVERGEHAAPVDVAHEQHRRVHELREAHVHDVVLFEVDFRRTARALDDDDIRLLAQAVERLADDREKLALVSPVFACGVVAVRLSHNDDLRTDVARRLEQDGVHAHIGRDAGGFRLHHLCAAHLAAVRRDERIERHVLRLERRDPVAVLPENAAQRRAEQTLARVRAGALYHDHFSHTFSSVSIPVGQPALLLICEFRAEAVRCFPSF